MTSETIQRAFKSRIYPTAAQAAAFGRCSGLTRFAYNWALARRMEAYKRAGEFISLGDLQHEFRTRRATEWPWALDLPDRVSEQAIRNLDVAYRNFFRRVKAGQTPGFPRFKARHPGYGSFQVVILSRHITSRTVQLPKMGLVWLAQEEYLPTDLAAQNITTTVSERAGKWHLAVQVEVRRPAASPGVGLAAVHLGVRNLAVVKNAEGVRRYENPKALHRELRHLKRLQQIVSRKVQGSANRKRAVARLQRLHERIADVRMDGAHRTTTDIVRRSATVALEQWDVKGMLETAPRDVSRYMADTAFAELARQIGYKADWRGVDIVHLEKGFSSTKRCAACGEINGEMNLSKAGFWCPSCGHREDREVNAVENVWLETTGKPPGCNAPGGGPSGRPVNGESPSRGRGHVVAPRVEEH